MATVAPFPAFGAASLLRALHGDTYSVTFKYPQTTTCDPAGLQGIQSAKPTLVVAEGQSESEISLGPLGGLLVVAFFFLGCIWKRGEDPTASL